MITAPCPRIQFFDSNLVESEKILFLDRDGTLNVDAGYTFRVEDLQPVNGMIDVVRNAVLSGWTPVVISNQSGIAKNKYTEEEARTFNEALRRCLNSYGIRLNYFLFCPHDANDFCISRKPDVGMLNYVQRLVPHADYFFIGNMETDLLAAEGAGVLYSDVKELEKLLKMFKN